MPMIIHDDQLIDFHNQLSNGQQLIDVTSKGIVPENEIDNYNKVINKENEEQKLSFRNRLLRLVSWLIWVQLIFFNLIVFLVVSSIVFDCSFIKNLDLDTSGAILDFLKYYISVTIAELLSMLFFIMKYVFKYYWFHCIIVFIGIIVSALAGAQGTMFTKSLIDDYIIPLTKAADPDFSGLLTKILQVAAFYGAGILGTFLHAASVMSPVSHIS